MENTSVQSLYVACHQQASDVLAFMRFCQHSRFFPEHAVVHIHGIWTSVHEIFALLWVRPDLRIIISELDPKGYTALNAKLTDPATSQEIRSVWQLLHPVLSERKPDFSAILIRFKHLLLKQVRFIPNAYLPRLPSAAHQIDPDTERALTALENAPMLSKLLLKHEVPKAHVIFAHAVQLNSYRVAQVHLRKTGVMFYSVHTQDHFDWQGTSAEYALHETTCANQPAALLFNHRVSSFWTDQTVFICHHDSV